MAAAQLGAVVKAAVLRAGRGAWVRLRVRIRDLAHYKREIIVAIRRAIKGRPKPTAEDVAVFLPAPEPEPLILVEMADREPALGPVLSCGPPPGANPSPDTIKIVATLPPPAPLASGKKLKTAVLLAMAAGLLYLAALLRAKWRAERRSRRRRDLYLQGGWRVVANEAGQSPAPNAQ